MSSLATSARILRIKRVVVVAAQRSSVLQYSVTASSSSFCTKHKKVFKNNRSKSIDRQRYLFDLFVFNLLVSSFRKVSIVRNLSIYVKQFSLFFFLVFCTTWEASSFDITQLQIDICILIVLTVFFLTQTLTSIKLRLGQVTPKFGQVRQYACTIMRQLSKFAIDKMCPPCCSQQ